MMLPNSAHGTDNCPIKMSRRIPARKDNIDISALQRFTHVQTVYNKFWKYLKFENLRSEQLSPFET